MYAVVIHPSSDALILGFESTCDETACAVVGGGGRVLSSVVASQADVHARFRGVVPEIACRHHIENILPVLRDALDRAGTSLEHLSAIAVANRPGLIGSLLVGVTAAKTLAWARNKPLIAVDHVQAHLYSVMLGPPAAAGPNQPAEAEAAPARIKHAKAPSPQDEHAASTARGMCEHAAPGDGPPSFDEVPASPDFPAIGLVCSGGHTAIYHLRSWTVIHRVGATIDDAVGEAYDKVASILGMGYPGGPIIDRLAQTGNPAAIRFPRSLLNRDSLDFSFSGLKTAVLYHVRGHQGRQRTAAALSEQQIADVAASFQAACIDVLLQKLRRALDRYSAKSLIIGGGVSANAGLRAAVTSLGVPAHIPHLAYCTDNAAMTAGLAHLLNEGGAQADLTLDAIPTGAIELEI